MTAPVAVALDPRRRLKMMVAGGAALVLALLLGSRMMGGGGSDSTAGATTEATPPTMAETGASSAPVARPEAAAVETFEVFTTKNPFIPLRSAVVAAVPAAATNPVAPGAAVPPVSASTAGAAAVAPAAAGAAATTAAGGQATEPTRSTTRVALLDVFAEGNRTVANVKVNDTVSKVGAGDTFASNFKVVSLDPAERCGRFLYGDDQFRLCKGEEVLK